MPYTADSVQFPSTPKVGEQFTFTATVCSTAEDNRTTEARLFFGGCEIASSEINHQGAFCNDFQSGTYIPLQSPPISGPNHELEVYTPGPGPITVTEPGTYDVTLSIRGSGEITETVEVVEPEGDRGPVTSDCSITTPTDTSPGDTITLEATATNDSTEAVDVEIEFTFGNATETQTITLPAGGTQTVTQAFTPDKTGEFVADVDHTVL